MVHLFLTLVRALFALIDTIIVWVIIGAMSIAELVLFIKYRGVNKAQKDVEDKKMV